MQTLIPWCGLSWASRTYLLPLVLAVQDLCSRDDEVWHGLAGLMQTYQIYQHTQMSASDKITSWQESRGWTRMDASFRKLVKHSQPTGKAYSSPRKDTYIKHILGHADLARLYMVVWEPCLVSSQRGVLCPKRVVFKMMSWTWMTPGQRAKTRLWGRPLWPFPIPNELLYWKWHWWESNHNL